MTLLETLVAARDSYLKGEHQTLGLLDEAGLLHQAAAGDAALALEAWELLDRVAGGTGEFSRFCDGGAPAVDGDEAGWVYRYDRSATEVSALLGKACLAAMQEAA